ncbi:MAG: OB-fold nucleic acid binding domain-containing protein [Candidatus Heimdallarchaeaceae archaeon]
MSDLIPRSTVSVYITDIVNGKLEKEFIGESKEKYRWVLITSNSEKTYNVRINGIIVKTYYSQGEDNKKSFATITIDDGTDTIRIKGWEEDAENLKKFQVGDNIEVFAKPRKSDDELYLVPEKTILIEDPNQELYLRAKRVKRYNKKQLYLPTEEEISKTHSVREKELVFSIIADTASEEGIGIEEVVEKTQLDRSKVEDIIQELSKAGDIYEPSPLKFKKL